MEAILKIDDTYYRSVKIAAPYLVISIQVNELATKESMLSSRRKVPDVVPPVKYAMFERIGEGNDDRVDYEFTGFVSK